MLDGNPQANQDTYFKFCLLVRIPLLRISLGCDAKMLHSEEKKTISALGLRPRAEMVFFLPRAAFLHHTLARYIATVYCASKQLSHHDIFFLPTCILFPGVKIIFGGQERE